MLLLLTITLLSSPAQSAQSVDTTLRAQLQSQIQQAAKMQAQKVDSLGKVVAELRDTVRFYERFGGGVILLLTIGAAAFVQNFINRQIKKLDKTISNKIYRVNPFDMPIMLPESGMEKQLGRLKRLDFHDIGTYQYLDDSCTKNAVVVLATKDEEAEKLKSFITKKGLAEREDVAFVLYTKGARINPAILSEFDNVTFANSHLTLVQALFVAARGIVRQAK
jgi:hypothetical protein